MVRSTKFVWIICWVVASVALIWPAMVNRGPVLFYDSLAYLNAPAAAVAKVTGTDLKVFGPDPLDPATAPGAAGAGGVPDRIETTDGSIQDGPEEASATLAGRSIYYGVVFLAALQSGGWWGMPLLQAALSALALLVFLRAYLGPDPVGAMVVLGGVAAVSAAPFFTSYMMPDFLAPLAVLAVIRLLAPPFAGWGERLFWMILLAFSAVCHVSHLMVATGMLLTVPLALWMTGSRVSFPGLGLVLTALLLAVLGEMAFSVAVAQVYGAPPLRPPFLAARFIVDGPGLQLLQQVCTTAPGVVPATPYEFCRYLDVIPGQTADTILWSGDPSTGVYVTADTASKARMSAEQMPFVIEVLKTYPKAQAMSSLGQFWQQLTLFSLWEFPYTAPMRDYLVWVLSGPRETAVTDTRFFRESFPLAVPDLVTRLTVLLSGLGLVLAGILPQNRGQETHREDGERTWAGLPAGVVIAVFLALLGYAAATGVFATPHDRYMARVYWLLPLLAGMALWRRRRQKG